MADNGIASQVGGTMQDPDERFQIYKDWRSVVKESPYVGAERFCRNKGINQTILEAIVREFRSYDPTGERWG